MLQNELIYALKDAGNGRNALFSEIASMECRQAVTQDARFDETLEKVRERAAYFLEHPAPQLEYSLYRLYEKTGSRDAYEEIYFERRERLNTFAFLCLFDETPVYLAALQDIIWSILNEYTWALPACMQRNSLAFVESGDKHDEMVELFACETAGALAEINFLLGDRMDSLVSQTLRQKVWMRILQPYLRRRGSYNWERGASNWTAVCAGSIGIAALYLEEDPEALGRILMPILDSMQFYLTGFAPDGACPEGLGYWSYGTTYFISFAQLLFQRTGGQVDLFASERVKSIASFAGHCKLFGNQAVNFSDCGPQFSYREGFLHLLQKKFPDIAVPAACYASSYGSDHCHRWCGFIRDIAWREDFRRHNMQIEFGHSLFAQTQWFISRQDCGGLAVSLAVKGGHNGESHNHNDVGHFIYQVQDNTFFIDMGAGVYDKNYFGAKRYESLFTSSLGHSVPVVNSCAQSPGRAHMAQGFRQEEADGVQRVFMELTDCYDTPCRLSRALEFGADGVVQIVDSFSARQFAERFIVACTEPPAVSDGCITLRQNDAVVRLLYASAEVELVHIEQLSGNYRTPTLEKYLIELTVRADIGKVCIDIKPGSGK